MEAGAEGTSSEPSVRALKLATEDGSDVTGCRGHSTDSADRESVRVIRSLLK